MKSLFLVIVDERVAEVFELKFHIKMTFESLEIAILTSSRSRIIIRYYSDILTHVFRYIILF